MRPTTAAVSDKIKQDENKPLTIGDVKLLIEDALSMGFVEETPLFVSSGMPGQEMLLQPLTGLTQWPVMRTDSRNAAYCVRGGKEDPNAVASFVFSIWPAATRWAWGLRFEKAPELLYVLPAMGCRDFLENFGGLNAPEQDSALFCEPVPLPDYMALSMYVARDEPDTSTPTIREVICPNPPYDGSQEDHYRVIGDNSSVVAAMYRLRAVHDKRLFQATRTGTIPDNPDELKLV